MNDRAAAPDTGAASRDLLERVQRIEEIQARWPLRQIMRNEPPGAHRNTSLTYISGTGTAGADNTAQTVKTLTMPANVMREVGDRLRIRAYWVGTTGGALTGTVALGPSGSEVSVSNTTDGGGTSAQVNEAELQYIDDTHANILEIEAGALGALSAPNVSGFTWSAAQSIIFTQDAAVGNHAILYTVIVEVLPRGVYP